MKKQYKLTALALTACLLTGCGAGETSALENTTAEKQPTEPVAETSAETFTETASATTEVPQETTAQENPIAPKEIAIDFTGVSEFHPEGTAAQPIPWKSFPRRITILLLQTNGTMHRKMFPFP